MFRSKKRRSMMSPLWTFRDEFTQLGPLCCEVSRNLHQLFNQRGSALRGAAASQRGLIDTSEHFFMVLGRVRSLVPLDTHFIDGVVEAHPGQVEYLLKER